MQCKCWLQCKCWNRVGKQIATGKKVRNLNVLSVSDLFQTCFRPALCYHYSWHGASSGGTNALIGSSSSSSSSSRGRSRSRNRGRSRSRKNSSSGSSKRRSSSRSNRTRSSSTSSISSSTSSINSSSSSINSSSSRASSSSSTSTSTSTRTTSSSSRTSSSTSTSTSTRTTSSSSISKRKEERKRKETKAKERRKLYIYTYTTLRSPLRLLAPSLEKSCVFALQNHQSNASTKFASRGFRTTPIYPNGHQRVCVCSTGSTWLDFAGCLLLTSVNTNPLNPLLLQRANHQSQTSLRPRAPGEIPRSACFECRSTSTVVEVTPVCA